MSKYSHKPCGRLITLQSWGRCRNENTFILILHGPYQKKVFVRQNNIGDHMFTHLQVRNNLIFILLWENEQMHDYLPNLSQHSPETWTGKSSQYEAGPDCISPKASWCQYVWARPWQAGSTQSLSDPQQLQTTGKVSMLSFWVGFSLGSAQNSSLWTGTNHWPHNTQGSRAELYAAASTGVLAGILLFLIWVV